MSNRLNMLHIGNWDIGWQNLLDLRFLWEWACELVSSGMQYRVVSLASTANLHNTCAFTFAVRKWSWSATQCTFSVYVHLHHKNGNNWNKIISNQLHRKISLSTFTGEYSNIFWLFIIAIFMGQWHAKDI